MGEIVFKPESDGLKRDYNLMALILTMHLMMKEEHFTLLLMEHLRITKEEITNILELFTREKEPGLTEKQLIIYYLALKLSCKKFKSDAFNKMTTQVEEKVYEELCEHAAISCRILKTNYAHLERFSKMAEKIDLSMAI